jgi:hypothetical protein
MLPPGCARLVTSPAPIGSTPIHTIGMVPAAASAASATGLLMATISAGLRPATSRARSGKPPDRLSPE